MIDTKQLQQIADLIDQLRSEETATRINSVQNLPLIATGFDAEKFRTELLPYMMDLLEDDEEVLVHFAEQVGGLLDLVGGPTHAEHLLKILEQLCAVEEITVREKVSRFLTVGN